MATSTQWQLTRETAERYEQILVPAILGPAAQALVDWADVQPGETALDVGCGTGAATRAAAEQVGPTGRAIGLDVNAAMIDVARSLPPIAGAAIEWHVHSAYQLPLDNQTVDVVLCAQVLQFLNDRPSAIAEMARVLKPSGRVAVSLWCELHKNPYMHAVAEAIARHIGEETAAALRAAFGFSRATDIRSLLAAAGFRSIKMDIRQLDLDLPPLQEFVPSYMSATPMAASFSAASKDARASVIQEVAERLARYTTATGVRVPFRTHLAMATQGSAS
jgi:ubiquinone/menaquinone biosynthesis C-methylase UbiE